jgi:hypothetical protein
MTAGHGDPCGQAGYDRPKELADLRVYHLLFTSQVIASFQ